MLGQLCVDDPPDGLGAGDGAANTGEATRRTMAVTAATARLAKSTTVLQDRFGDATGVIGVTFSSAMNRIVDGEAQNGL